jgi:hypothetical protein
MSWLDVPGVSDEHRLAAEIANEPQWVVFDDAVGEDAWAEQEVEEISLAAVRWVGLSVTAGIVPLD